MDNSAQDSKEPIEKTGEKALAQVYTQNINDTTRWSLLSFASATIVYFYLAWQLGAWQLYATSICSAVATLFCAVNFLPALRLRPHTQINLLVLTTEFTVLAMTLLVEGVGWLLALTLILISSTILIITMQRPDWKLALRSLVVAGGVLLLDRLPLEYRLSIVGLALWEYIFAILVIVFGIALIYNIGWNLQNQSLRTRLITTFGFMAMLSILGVAYFLNRSEGELLRAETGIQFQQQVATGAVFTSSFLQRELEALAILGGEAALREAVVQPTAASASQMLQTLQTTQPAYQNLWLATADGSVVMATISTAVNPSAEPWWPTVTAGQPYLGDLRFSDGHYELTLAVPVRQAGQTAVVGVLAGRYDLRAFFDQLQLLNRKNGKDITILTPQGAIALNNTTAPPTASPLTPVQISRLLAVDSLLIASEDSTAPAQLMSLAPVVGRTAVSDLHWQIFLAQAEGQAFSARDEQQNSNILVGMAGSIIFILVAIYFSTLLVRPITHLTEAAMRVTSGDLNVTVDIDTGNEMGVLANAFNTMTRQLNELVNELEAKVARRTAALSQANAQLVSSELRYRALATLVADYAGVVVVTHDGSRIEWLSDQAQALLGDLAAAADAMTPLLTRIHPDDHADALAMVATIQNGEQASVDLRFYVTPEQIIWLRVHAHGFAVANERGSQQIYVAAQDITAQRQAQEALSQAERLRSVGVLAGGIAHDFNNLLTGILGQASLVQLRLQQNRPIEKNLDSMIKAAEHAADLTQKLLAYAGKGRFELRVIDLNYLLADNRSFLQTLIPLQVDLSLDLAPQPAYIEADTGQIQQVVMNLILNAANACADNGGTVYVQTRTLTIDATNPPPTIAETTLVPGQYHVMTVRDTGKGMDESVLSRIFEPFFTTRENGRGLGLSATLGIIQAHHGGLHVTSTAAVGTEFTIYLPTAAAPVAQPPAVAQAVVPPRSASKILVVDDERWVRDVVTDGLQAFGFQAMTADNGREGLILYQAHKEDIQLVIVDMQMPLMNGADFIEQIRINDADQKIILSSGYGAMEMTGTLMRDDNLWFLQKPYSIEQLAKTVDRVLNAHSTRQ